MLVAAIGDIFTLAKDSVMIAAVLVFLILACTHWSIINGLITQTAEQLKSARLAKVTIAGFEVTFNDTAQKVRSATESLIETQHELQKVASSVKDPALSKQLGDILHELNSATTTTESAEKALQAGAMKTTETSSALGRQPVSLDGGQWVVAVSADKQTEPAQYEVNQLKRLGYVNAEIFERKGWLRTVVPFKTESDANDALVNIRQKRRTSAYIANTAQWCQRIEAPKPGDDHQVCVVGDATSD